MMERPDKFAGEFNEKDKRDISKMIKDAYQNGYRRGYGDAMYEISKEADKLNFKTQSMSIHPDSLDREISKRYFE